jgi:hypothetical protein
LADQKCTDPDLIEREFEDELNSQFHHVSLEADDDEVVLLLSNPNVPDTTRLPSWLTSTRVVVPRTEIVHVRRLNQADVASRWPVDLQKSFGPSFRNWVELECKPRSSKAPIALLLALPHADIARRFHEAFTCTPRPPRPLPVQEHGKRGALLCELQMLAKVEVSQEIQAYNCGMAMRRAICECVGIQRSRVQILSVREGGGSIVGWASAHLSGIQRSIQPSELGEYDKPGAPDV